MAQTEGVNAVSRAIDILRVLGGASDAMKLGEIAHIAGLPLSTVHRIAQSLIESNFIATDRINGGLRLGPEFARLAAVSGQRIAPLTRPYLQRLSQETSEGASLSLLEGTSVRFLDQAISGQGLHAVSLVGSTMAAHSTANGKAMLAALPDRTLQALLPERLPQLTPHTIVDRRALTEELARIRETGLAYDREENELGISAVGRVIRDAVGNVAAISIAAPVDRFDAREDVLAVALERTVADVEMVLGFADPQSS